MTDDRRLSLQGAPPCGGAVGGNQDMSRTKGGAQHKIASGRGFAWSAGQGCC